MRNRKSLILISSVVGVHLIFFFSNFKVETPPPPPKKSIVVSTYSLPPPLPRPRPSKKKEAPVSNKQAPKTVQKKEILKDLKDTLSKIEPKALPQGALSLPKKIQSLQIDHNDKTEETDYHISLAHSLKRELELPEHGDVKLELTVNHTGKVIKLRILQADSERNRRYLELNLPQMNLPPFSEDLKNENDHTFTLTFVSSI